MKRYDFDADDCGHIFGMEEQENGDWVKALDHDLIVSKLDLQLIALAECNDRLRTLLADVNKTIDKNNSQNRPKNLARLDLF